MTREELAQHDGREGRRAYVAVNGKIYDFTGSDRWQAGDHLGRHRAGEDLTEALLKAPHVRAVVERFPVVALLEEVAPQPAAGGMEKRLAVAGAALLALLLVLWLLR